jgi:hypothetical protein
MLSAAVRAWAPCAGAESPHLAPDIAASDICPESGRPASNAAMTTVVTIAGGDIRALKDLARR